MEVGWGDMVVTNASITTVPQSFVVGVIVGAVIVPKLPLHGIIQTSDGDIELLHICPEDLARCLSGVPEALLPAI